ncbi:hypothetical protein V2J09_010722 [Rumex salicifolius]
MVLGYAYPAYGCYKTVEKNKFNIDDLRFWCQYWILMAALSVFEVFGDIFISWLPLYGEMKLAFIIYLWYPKTKGTKYIYEAFVRPVLTNHESEIDKHLQDLKLRAWDLALYYWQNCAQLGHGAFLQLLQFLLLQSQKLKTGNYGSSTNKKTDNSGASSPPTPPPAADYMPSSPMRSYVSFSKRGGSSETAPSSPSRFGKKWPPHEPASPVTGQSMPSRLVAPPPQVTTVQMKPHEAYTQYVQVEEF